MVLCALTAKGLVPRTTACGVGLNVKTVSFAIMDSGKRKVDAELGVGTLALRRALS